jgi:hypothetical protein
MSVQKERGDDDTVDVERRGDGLKGIYVDGTPLGSIIQGMRERIDKLEKERDRLEEELEEVRGFAESAESTANEAFNTLERVDNARADGGPGQKDVARNILRDLVVKRTYDGLNSGGHNHSGQKSDQKGSVEIAEVPKLSEAREGPDVAWMSAKRAAKELDDTWSVLEFDEDAEPKVLRAKTSRNFPPKLVDIVEKSLGRDDLANAVVAGGD